MVLVVGMGISPLQDAPLEQLGVVPEHVQAHDPGSIRLLSAQRPSSIYSAQDLLVQLRHQRRFQRASSETVLLC